MWASEAPCSSISKNQMKSLKPGHHIVKILLFRTHHLWNSTTELILLYMYISDSVKKVCKKINLILFHFKLHCALFEWLVNHNCFQACLVLFAKMYRYFRVKQWHIIARLSWFLSLKISVALLTFFRVTSLEQLSLVVNKQGQRSRKTAIKMF